MTSRPTPPAGCATYPPPSPPPASHPAWPRRPRQSSRPGDWRRVDAWAGSGPGGRGVLDPLAPPPFGTADVGGVGPKPPVLWIRGADDVIVSDPSLYDLAYLGSLGAIPGWPGEQTWPPQPMLAQTRTVLDGYAAAGGRYRAGGIADSGHGPHLEQPGKFLPVLGQH